MADLKRDFKGIWIPKDIWLDEDLSVMEKLVFVEIDSLDNENGCFAGNEHFSKFFSLSKNRCSEIIKSLESKGFIDCKYVYKEGTKSVEKRVIRCIRKPEEGIRYSDRGIRKIDRGIRKTEGGYSENREDINTSFSNTLINTFNNKDYMVNVPLSGVSDVDSKIEEFWSSYPKKVGKVLVQKKLKTLLKNDLDSLLFDQIMFGLSRHKESDQWRRGIIPNPMTWLNREGWNDEINIREETVF